MHTKGFSIYIPLGVSVARFRRCPAHFGVVPAAHLRDAHARELLPHPAEAGVPEADAGRTLDGERCAGEQGRMRMR